MKRLLIALLLCAVLLGGTFPALAAPVPPGIISAGTCIVKTDMQLAWAGTLQVNYHSRTRLPLYAHIPGGITPATIRLQGGVGNVQLTPAWIDYVDRINWRNPQILKYLFHKNSGWQNSSTYARVEELVFEGQTVNVLRISGLRAYLQTYFINEKQPLTPALGDWRIEKFSIVTRDDTMIGAPPGPAKIILMARKGESLWIPTNYLICGSRLPKSIIVTVQPALTLRATPSITGLRVGSLAYGSVSIVTETEIDVLGGVWGRVAGGWVALLYNGQQMTDWKVAVR